ncbi:uncharacterized protein LOC142237437 [Haematobia irritans]|uniref:uncharacterized protein LOC142237437 n=1 Tax=Haematobia irritans TaxID=7368 RepID=UPI003F4FF52A
MSHTPSHTNAMKRSSNEPHDDESKKFRLEKSGSSNILATNVSSSLISIGTTSDIATKKIKGRKMISGDIGTPGTHQQQYQLIIEDSASTGAFSEESCGGMENNTKTYSSSGGGEEMVLIRKQVPGKANDCNDVTMEERIIHFEGDPGGGSTASTFMTSMSNKTSKRLQIGMNEATKKSFGDGIDVKLISTSGDSQGSGKFSMMAAGEKKPEQQILLTASSTSINPQNTFTYSRVCSVGNVTGPGGETVSLKSLQSGPVKNQSLVVSSKKLLPEVTQTTAKVSIGNTTISVPLLKPLNSSQIIHQTGSNSSTQVGSADGTKSVIHTIQTNTSQSPQTQLSKILNIKRGHKMSQPTFVSLSQLQIKPVSSAKIVQAKVVSKKIPLQFQTVQANKTTMLQQTSGVVTITSTKSDLQQGSQTQMSGQVQSPQKKQQLNFVKDLPSGAIIKTSSSTNVEEIITSSQTTVPSSTSDQSILITEKCQINKNITGSGGAENASPSIISTDFLPASVKVVHTSTAGNVGGASLRQSMTTNTEAGEQSQSQAPQRINICPTISIVRQNSPQLVTTSGNVSTVSLSMADAVGGQQKLILTKSQFANVNSSNINTTSGANTVATSFPRNISLMLAKTSTGQQVFTNAGAKTTLCVTTSAYSNQNRTNPTARMNLSINPNALSTVTNTAQSASASSSTVAHNDGEANVSSDFCNSSQDSVTTTHQQQTSTQMGQTSIVQNRKIIQVLPGGLYSSSGGSFVQISKPKAETEEEKKASDMETTVSHQSVHQHMQQQSQQQQLQHQQSSSSSQQSKVHLQIQHQHSQQQIQVQQIQSLPQQQQRHQLMSHQRQHPTTEQQVQQHQHQMTAINTSKSEESNNVLLKQLLQNSNSAPLNNQTSRSGPVGNPTNVLPGRKVINVRAPSLGLVSSLEAQLARPVIPPVPASESSTHTPSTPTQSTTVSTTLSQNSKLESTKLCALSVGNSSAPSSPRTIGSVVTTATSNITPALVASSKGLIQNSDKPKFVSSPLISKETSFVSKPQSLSEPNESNVEVLSVQPSSGDSANNKGSGEQLTPQQSQLQQQFEHLTSPTTTGQQILSQSTFKAFTQNTSHSAKIGKYVQEAKKEHQVQPQFSAARVYSTASNKEKNTVSINTHVTSHSSNSSTSNMVVAHATQPQQIIPDIQQQQQSKMFSTTVDSNLGDQSGATNNNKINESIATHPVASNHNMQQQDSTKSLVMQAVKMEVDETGTLQTYQTHQQQMPLQIHHQQHQNRQQRTTPSPMSSTATPTNSNSVASTPTGECQPPINIINKQQILLQQQQAQVQSQANSPSSGPSPVTKDGDNRKKRKRDQQKQRKQITVNAKETTVISSTTPVGTTSALNAANNKKRSRKSLKLEEDYDSFIENMMLHLRQMPPMQVLEPQLNVNYGVCNLYGWRNCTSSSSSPHKESRQSERGNLFEQELDGVFGAGYIPNKVPFYNLKKIQGHKSSDDPSTSSSIQNNYYDQEFSSFTYKSEHEKLSSWTKIYRERAVDTPEIVNNKLLMPVDPVKTMRLNMLQQETFPGLILMSSTQQRMGRMSPVIPLVNSMALITKRKKTPLKPLENDADNGIHMKDLHDDMMDFKGGMKNSPNSQNVIISLPSSSAERLLDVLKNLANLLQINTPIPYKVVEDTDTDLDEKAVGMSVSDRETALRNLSIQDILNGRSKMCRFCGKAIKGRCLKNYNDNTKSSIQVKLMHPTQPRYFCSKICFIQFRLSSQKKQLSASSIKSVLASQEGTSFESDFMNEILDIKPDISNLLEEKNDVKAMDIVKPAEHEQKAQKISFRYYNPKCFQTSTPVKRMSEKEIRDMLFKMDITMTVSTTLSTLNEPNQQIIEDRRTCVLCSQIGDGVSDGPSRLLNYDVDKWVHLNCALWSTEVYETISGGLMNFHTALQVGLNQSCNTCQQLGATVKCYKTRCGAVFHLPCAIRDQCVFYQNKTIHCQAHATRSDKDKELLTLSVPRRVFVERDENRQVAAIMHHSEMVNVLRVGSLIFLNVGQLLPHQLEAFHTTNCIYPIGYKIIRFYWSMRRPNKRCRYVCSIAEVAGRPEFRIVVQEPSEPDVELRDISPKSVWHHVLQAVAEIRRSHNLVKLHSEFISGEDLFGLTEPAIVRIIESLPGVETLTNYRFKYGRNPLLDLPLALNPSGAARTEPKLRQLMGWKRHHPQRTCSSVSSLSGHGHQGTIPSVAAAGEVTCPYSKQFVHSKSSQYKKMKQEWRNNVYLARSKIAGLGLYAARDMEKHTMIIEYIGEVIRSEVSEIREKQYEARNRGIYMFRLDEDRVVDATLCGGLARYINHSCNPNCVTEIVEVDRELRIIIFAKRRINRSEELSYDYKFDIEDDGSKIPCMCGAPNCRKWMN